MQIDKAVVRPSIDDSQQQALSLGYELHSQSQGEQEVAQPPLVDHYTRRYVYRQFKGDQVEVYICIHQTKKLSLSSFFVQKAHKLQIVLFRYDGEKQEVRIKFLLNQLPIKLLENHGFSILALNKAKAKLTNISSKKFYDLNIQKEPAPLLWVRADEGWVTDGQDSIGHRCFMKNKRLQKLSCFVQLSIRRKGQNPAKFCQFLEYCNNYQTRRVVDHSRYFQRIYVKAFKLYITFCRYLNLTFITQLQATYWPKNSNIKDNSAFVRGLIGCFYDQEPSYDLSDIMFPRVSDIPAGVSFSEPVSMPEVFEEPQVSIVENKLSKIQKYVVGTILTEKLQ